MPTMSSSLHGPRTLLRWRRCAPRSSQPPRGSPSPWRWSLPGRLRSPCSERSPRRPRAPARRSALSGARPRGCGASGRWLWAVRRPPRRSGWPTRSRTRPPELPLPLPFLPPGGLDGPRQVSLYAPESLRRLREIFVQPGDLRTQMPCLLLDGPDAEGYLGEVARPAAVSPWRLAPDVLESPDDLDQVENEGREEHHHRERQEHRHASPPSLLPRTHCGHPGQSSACSSIMAAALSMPEARSSSSSTNWFVRCNRGMWTVLFAILCPTIQMSAAVPSICRAARTIRVRSAATTKITTTPIPKETHQTR